MQFHLTNGKHQRAAEAALRAGLKRHGALAWGPNVVACWGWRAGKRLRALGREVLVLERGYLGDRFAWTSIGWNGLNGRADFPHYPPDGGARFAETGARLLDWRGTLDGDSVLLVGQVAGDASLAGRDLRPWYLATAAACAAAYGLPVRFRPHPLDRLRRPLPGYETDAGPLETALERARAVVTWNSNVGVDAMLAGVPTVTFDPGSMAYPIAGHELRDPGYPEKREAWAYELAWRQWREDEIADGTALEGLLGRLAGAPAEVA